ncbi:MAG: rhomboid family intramembrane serine protease, partial [Acidobacteriia bacterium]|nr:rhomboid family intramembrane serine protease [Terriglobia bacterium]
MDKRRMCPNCRAFITTDDKVCPYCDIKVGPKAIERRNPSDLMGGLIPHARFTTVVILTINVGLYLATMLYSMRAGNESLMDLDGQTLLLFGAKYSPAVFAGQYWRLLTAGFLHGGLIHIFMNTWVLFDLGAQVEEMFGTSRMIVIYTVSTIAGFLASAFWFSGLSVGASAGIFGLIGAMITVGMKNRSAMGDAIKGMYTRWAIYGLIFGLLPGMRIDNAAHLGGLAGGFAVAWVAGQPGLLADSWKERLWNWASGIAIALTVLA